MMRCFVFFLLAPLALCACNRAPRADNDLIPRDLFFGPTAAAFGVLSPDGQTLAYAKGHRGRLNVWVRDAALPDSDGRPLTAFDRGQIGTFAWSADGRYLLVLHDPDGSERQHLFRVDASARSDQSAIDLTPLAGVHAAVIGVPDAHPVRITVAMDARKRGLFDVFYIDLDRRDRWLAWRNDNGFARFWADLRGDPALALHVGEHGVQTVFDVAGERPEALWSCAVDETCLPLGLIDAPRRALAIADTQTDLRELRAFDIDAGTWKTLHRDPLGRVDVAHAVRSRQDGRVLAVSYLDERQRTYAVDEGFDTHLARTAAALPGADAVWRSPTRADRYWIVKEVVDVDEGSNYRFDTVSGEFALLYESYRNLPRARMATRQPVRYRARDGHEIGAYLTTPPGAPGTPGPAVLLVHGGPWQRDHWGWDAQAQFFASRGYVVLQPNFRGSSGFGKAYADAGDGQWGTGRAQHDLTDAARWLIEQELADPARIAIMGASYGGYAALAGLAFTSDLYAAGIAIAAPADLQNLLVSLPAQFEHERRRLYRRVGDPERDADALRAASPALHADRFRAPLLLIHGANDPRVPRAQADRMAAALRERGAAVEYLVLEDQGHQATSDYLLTMAAAEQFLARHLGGAAEPLDPQLNRRIDDASARAVR